MYQSKEKIQTVVLLLADLICFVISYFGGGYLWLVLYRNVSVQNMKSELMDSFGIVLVIYMLILLFSDLEKNFIRRNLARDFWAALEASVIMIFVTALTIFLQHNNADASRGVYFCIAGMNLVLFFVAHAAIKYYLLHIYRNKRGTNQLFLVTTTDRVKDTLAEIENAKDWEHRLTGIAIIDDNQIGTWYEGIPVVATYDTMFQYAKEQIVDEVFLNVPYDTGESLAKVVEAFEDMGATVHITIELLIESPGPLFFAQKRVGKNGRFFKIYKFRSMYKDAEERKKELESQNEMNGFMFKMKDDPRITKVGKFIRKTSIDELPQFYNVLKGDMSLVGTRPPTVDEFRQYESHQKRRLSAKPGITGLWQVYCGNHPVQSAQMVAGADLCRSVRSGAWRLQVQISEAFYRAECI